MTITMFIQINSSVSAMKSTTPNEGGLIQNHNDKSPEKTWNATTNIKILNSSDSLFDDLSCIEKHKRAETPLTPSRLRTVYVAITE